MYKWLENKRLIVRRKVLVASVTNLPSTRDRFRENTFIAGQCTSTKKEVIFFVHQIENTGIIFPAYTIRVIIFQCANEDEDNNENEQRRTLLQLKLITTFKICVIFVLACRSCDA